MKEGLLIFQKNFTLGKVKTRLAATIGDHAALEAYNLLLHYTHQIVSKCHTKKILFYSNHLEENILEYPTDYRFEVQSGDDLGEKMSNAFLQLFEENFDRLVIIGTDCAEITSELISQAFEVLKQNEVVIGPAHDGGYYLLGMRSFIPGLFKGIPWSTDQVTALTKEYLTQNEISFSMLAELSDIDYEEDWLKYKDNL